MITQKYHNIVKFSLISNALFDNKISVKKIYAMTTTFVRQFPKHVFIPLQGGDSDERQPLVKPSALCPTRCVYFSVNVPIVYQRCQMR